MSLQHGDIITIDVVHCYPKTESVFVKWRVVKVNKGRIRLDFASEEDRKLYEEVFGRKSK